MKKDFLLILSCFFVINLSFGQDYNPPKFTLIKTDVCLPSQAIDLLMGKSIIAFVQVSNYHNNSSGDWEFLANYVSYQIKDFKETDDSFQTMHLIFLTEVPNYDSMYCESDSPSPKYPVTNSNGEGIVLCRYKFHKNINCGEFDGYLHNAISKLVDENGNIVYTKKFCK